MLVDPNNFKITPENLYLFAYTNVNELVGKKDIKGIVINLHGLGGGESMEDDVPMAKYYTDKNIVIVLPYCGPWNWMNDNSINTIDMIVDTIIDIFGLDKDIPVIPTGGSMGGMGSLVYTIYSKHNIVGCAVSCAVCDLVTHVNESPYVCRTLLAAFGGSSLGFEKALLKASPLHQIDKLPFIPYYFASCTLDDDVLIKNHSDVLVPKMKELGHDVTYDVVPDRGHVNLTPEVNQRYLEFPINILLKK